MSKEQLEELKDWKMNLNGTLVLNGHEISEELKEKTRKYRDLLDYAIKQAERVQELEEVNHTLHERVYGLRKDIKKASEITMRGRMKNKRYREALEFYANEDNWVYGKVQHIVRGEKARKALEGDSDE